MSSRKEHFASSPRAGALVDAILVLLDFGCVWTPMIGSATADPPASVGLFFELLRAEKAVFDIGTWATSLGRESGALKPVAATDECLRNLRTVAAHFSDPIAKRRATLGEGGQLEPECVGLASGYADRAGMCSRSSGSMWRALISRTRPRSRM